MTLNRCAPAVFLLLLGACCRPGPEDPSPTVDDVQVDDLGQPLVVRYLARLQQLDSKNVYNAFELAETCMTLFLINGPQLYEKLSSDQKERLKDVARLVKDGTGQTLLKTSLENFYRVFILSEKDDAMLKAASLRMIMRILDDMADDPSLRTIETANTSDFRAALVNSSYRYASAALALRYEQLTRTSGRALARAGAVADSLLRLAEYPSMKDEFKTHLRKLSDEVRSKPSSCFAIPADARGEILIREALSFQDSAVREKASGGHPLVIYSAYQQALAYFVLTGEVVDARDRDRFSGELRRIPLILADLEKMMLKGQ